MNSDRIKMLSVIANHTNLTIDFLDYFLAGLSVQAMNKLVGNASGMPSIMKSSESPYVFRSARAPSSEILE